MINQQISSFRKSTKPSGECKICDGPQTWYRCRPGLTCTTEGDGKSVCKAKSYSTKRGDNN